VRIAVVGGGPAGLYFARLFRRSRPGATIDLFERGPEGATWGFGVGLGGRAMNEIAEADPEVHDSIVAAMRLGRNQVIRLNDEALELGYADATGAISRLELLRILTDACRDVGVTMHFESPITSARDLADYDLVVAADGAGSALRSEREAEFGTTRRMLTNRFAWFGVARAMPMGLVFRSVEGGAFVGHHYAYGQSMSTFVAECDEIGWRRLGLEEMTDEERLREMERIFAPELDGAPLIANHSIWRRFPAVANAHYHQGNIVLLGDSLRVAHFSIGSGTRLAMEDAAALCRALIECNGVVAEALLRFAELRRPAREKFAQAAQLSFEWYERIAENMRQPLIPFIHAFLTRTGRVGDDRLRTYAPDFYKTYQEYREGAVH
jgi:2-polyprenyl-6-methoxyphenol hydroxylase-like FAD-dependent oxidoreductase